MMNMSGEYPIGPARRSVARRVLTGAAMVIGAVTVVALVIGAVLMLRGEGPVSGVEVVALAALAAFGLTACALVAISLSMLRHLERISERATAIDQQTAILAEQTIARTQADTYYGRPAINPEEVRQLLVEIRETLLLPEPERVRRFNQHMEAEFRRRLANVTQFVASRDFHRARQELNELSERFGDDERVKEARSQLEQAAESVRAHDFAQLKARVEDLMGMARWDQAEHVARELAQKYPTAADAAALVTRVVRERQLFEQKHRQRMHEEIQRFVHERRWREAVDAARRFIETFPTGQDTDALRTQLETLEANAEIQLRQDLERRIKQCLHQKQYWDALALSRRIINDYPLSPQANALRGQLPRIEELARRYQPQV